MPVLQVTAGASLVLGDGSQVGVVLEVDGRVKSLAEHLTEGQPGRPAGKVGGVHENSALGIAGPRDADPDDLDRSAIGQS
jgi:hypothetical protein